MRINNSPTGEELAKLLEKLGYTKEEKTKHAYELWSPPEKGMMGIIIRYDRSPFHNSNAMLHIFKQHVGLCDRSRMMYDHMMDEIDKEDETE